MNPLKNKSKTSSIGNQNSARKMERGNPYSEIEKIHLPHFYDVVSQFKQAFSHKFHALSRTDGVLAKIKTQMIHEGKNATLQRGEEPPDVIQMQEGSAEVEFTSEEIDKFNDLAAETAIQKMADQHSSQLSRQLFEKLDQVTEKTGNKVDGQGKPLGHDMIIEVLNKMEHNFRDGPGSSDIVAVVSPTLEGRIRKLGEELNRSPELQSKYNSMMAGKYEQFRDREMDRDLAG